jgi:prophage regulatory protein
MADTATQRPRRLLKKPEVCARIAKGRSALDGMVREGEFPRPVKLGTTAAWPEHEVDAWIDARIAERDSQAAEAGE